MLPWQYLWRRMAAFLPINTRVRGGQRLSMKLLETQATVH